MARRKPEAGGREPYVALLRGINVGGKNPLPMAALVELFTNCQCSAVQTYIQSGNVVFHCTAAVAARIGAVVSQRIRKRFGYQLPVIVRSGHELDQILRANPFLIESGGKPGGKPGIAASVDAAALHVMFLADQPTSQAVAGLDPARSPPDSFAVVGREIYLHCPNGLARSKLTNSYFDARLATHGTCRNWRTALALRDLARAIRSI
jgi:uncharacterized protein (DUF1697 family)